MIASSLIIIILFILTKIEVRYPPKRKPPAKRKTHVKSISRRDSCLSLIPHPWREDGDFIITKPLPKEVVAQLRKRKFLVSNTETVAVILV